MKKIPKYLQKYIVQQNYEQYTPMDHACWRFIMRINKSYFSENAYHKYLEGLNKTGITINRIPKISNINAKLAEFGWSAIGVRGFLPPLIFMDFQSKAILPIACDMRSIQHITYTPAPDIVHEAAGHSPMIADNDYANFLKNYGKIALKAISSVEDFELYQATRYLSDIKENPKSTKSQIVNAETNVKNKRNLISYISEASYLSRINWWTVEYGLIGKIDKPKIYGAGLLSSIGESENCLKNSVKKIPISIDCINHSYDITEQQPKLFVSNNFKSLNKILNQFSLTMAYKIGGRKSIEKAIKAKTVCTVEVDKKIQISGKVEKVWGKKIDYIQLTGPVQISYKGKEVSGHGTDRHPNGFGFPIGKLNNSEKTNLLFVAIDTLGNNRKLNSISLEFESGLSINGNLKTHKNIYRDCNIFTFINCTVSYKDNILFQPEWGEYDLIYGNHITSVFGGPADIDKYYKYESFDKSANKNKIYSSNANQQLNIIYSTIRDFRQKRMKKFEILEKLYKHLSKEYPDDWLAKIEIYEIIYNKDLDWKNSLKKSIKYHMKNVDSELAKAIKNSIRLIEK